MATERRHSALEVLLVSGLDVLAAPVCLLCAERRIADCHRLQIAEFLASRGFEIEHLE